jgi:segregation and condensation protein A
LGKVTFRQITEAIYDRIEVVVRFLAILELYKQGRVTLEQSDRFGEIEVQWIAGDDTGFEAVLQIDDYEG